MQNGEMRELVLLVRSGSTCSVISALSRHAYIVTVGSVVGPCWRPVCTEITCGC